MGDITNLVGGVKDGDHEAVRGLWEAYYPRLVRLARVRLAGLPRRAADEEDVALAAFDSFVRGAEAGRFPRLDGRDDLWQVLVLLTARKAADLKQHERREKRGGGRVRGDSALGEAVGFAEVIGREPSPAFAAEVAEQCRVLLEALPDGLRSLATGKLEGLSNAELAARLECSHATVERKLQRIRAIWEGMTEED